MDEQNKDLLEAVIVDRLAKSLNSDDPDEREKAFKEAMQAVDRGNERTKAWDSYDDDRTKNEIERQKLSFEKEKLEIERQKLSFEKEKHETERQKIEQEESYKKKESKRNFVLKVVEVAVPIFLLGVRFVIDRSNIKMIGNYEKDYTWTTTPGKLLSKKLFEK